jgi:hypothetical protein
VRCGSCGAACAHRFQNAHRFHRTATPDELSLALPLPWPRIEVRAQHDHFISLVGAGQLSHDVLGLDHHITNRVAHLGLDLHRHAQV